MPLEMAFMHNHFYSSYGHFEQIRKSTNLDRLYEKQRTWDKNAQKMRKWAKIKEKKKKKKLNKTQPKRKVDKRNCRFVVIIIREEKLRPDTSQRTEWTTTKLYGSAAIMNIRRVQYVCLMEARDHAVSKHHLIGLFYIRRQKKIRLHCNNHEVTWHNKRLSCILSKAYIQMRHSEIISTI